MSNKKVFVGSDHAGFSLKKRVINYLKDKKISYEDLGPFRYDKEDDYPDYGFKVAEKVSRNLGEGILICKMAGGMIIVANKVKGVRALACNNIKETIFAREHNHANIIILAALKINSQRKLGRILDLWFNTEWSEEERHQRRIQKISEYEGI